MIKWGLHTADDLDHLYLEKAVEFLLRFSQTGISKWSTEHFEWKLGSVNPAGKGFLTLAIDNGKVIGTTSITKKIWWDGSIPIIVGEIGDTYVDPEYRKGGEFAETRNLSGSEFDYLRHSVFGRLVTETLSRAVGDGLDLIFGTPNQLSMPGYVRRLGFFHFDGYQNKRFVRPGLGFFKDKLPILRVIWGVFYHLERVYSKTFSRLLSLLTQFELEEISELDSEMDALWERVKSLGIIGPLRDSSYFNYRFLNNPAGNYRIWVIRKHGEIVGAFVTSLGKHQNGSNTYSLVDWLVDPRDRWVLTYAVIKMVAMTDDVSTMSFSFWASSNRIQKFLIFASGFIDKDTIPIIYNGLDPCMAKRDFILEFTLATSDNG